MYIAEFRLLFIVQQLSKINKYLKEWEEENTIASILLKKKSQCYAITCNIAFHFDCCIGKIYWKNRVLEREDGNDRGMEKMFSYEKKLKRLGLFRERESKRETMKLPKVMITVKKSRMGTCTVFLKHE